MPNPAQDILNAARTGVLTGLIGAGITDAAIHYVRTGQLAIPGLPPGVEEILIGVIGAAEQEIGAPLFEGLVSSSLGLAGLGAPGSQEENAVRTLKRSIGFSVGLPLVVGRAEAPLKALLGHNLGESLFRAFEKIPEEMGLMFFMGETLAAMFRTAVGTPLEEAIAERTRPARLAFRELRGLFKAHALTEEQARGYLARAGYRDQDIEMLLGLNDTLPSIGELQQAFIDGIRDESWVRDRLDRAGFDADNIDVMVELYLRRAETAGGDMLRNVARVGFTDDHLTEAQYRAILDQVHVPAKSAELDVQAIALQKSWKVHQLSVGEIKGLHAAGQIDNAQSTQALVERGYTAEQADALVLSWSKAKKAARSGLDQSRILSYLAGGVLTAADAVKRLIDLNIRPEDAQFLVDHPMSWGGVYAHPLTPATVVSAFLDDIIDDTQATDLLDGLGVEPTERNLQLRIAVSKKSRGPKPKAAHKTLTEAQVMDAYRYSLATPAWAVRELVTLGYADADAQLIIAVEDAKAAQRAAGAPATPDWWQILT